MNIGEFKNFFKEGTEESMTRLVVFICSIAAFIVTIAGIALAFKDSLTYIYTTMTTTTWAAAIGAKNWAKNIENKKPKEEINE